MMIRILSPNNLTSPLLWATILLPLASSPALAEAPCETFCVRAQEEFRETCNQQNKIPEDCMEQSGLVYEACAEDQCNLAVKVPEINELASHVDKWVSKRWEGDYQRVAISPYLNHSGKPWSYLLFYTNGGKISLEDLYDLSQDPDIDSIVKVVEVGSGLESVPIRAYWEGSPPELTEHNSAKNALAKAFGDHTYQIVARHWHPLRPILEFSAEGNSYFYDTSGGSVAFDYQPIPSTKTDLDIEQLMNLELFKREWRNFLQLHGN